MRTLVLMLAAWALSAGHAAAASSWQEYVFPDNGFAIQFPDEPAVTSGTVDSTEAAGLPATFYMVEHENILYRITVVDPSGHLEEGSNLIGEAAYTLMREGDVVFTDFPRVGTRGNAIYGTGMVVDTADGRRVRSSFYFTKGRFYRTDAIVLPERGDLDQTVPARFDQTLRFNVE